MTIARLCRLALVWGIALSAALGQKDAGGMAVSGGGSGFKSGVLREVASGQVFNNINRNDVRAAFKVWVDALGKQSGFMLDTRIDVLDNIAEIKERVKSHSVELAALSVTDYLELESSHLLVPALTDTRNAQSGALYSYVLLVNSGTTSVAGLRGKNVLVASRLAPTGAAWLDVLLAKEKLGRAASFFVSVKASDKAQACILPLFFGAVDACVVDETSLNLAKEMNPQLGRLSVLARSRPMIETVIAVPAEEHPYQKEMIEGILALHENPRGRQLLMAFKTDRIVRIQPGDLDSARELWRDYYRLAGAAPNRSAIPALLPAPEAHPGNSGAVSGGKE